MIDLSEARKHHRRVERNLREAESLIDETRRLSVLDVAIQCPFSPSPPPRRKTFVPPPGIECVVCYTFETEITSAPCGHVCCVKCMEKIMQATAICPVCRRKVPKNQLRRIYLS